MFLNLETNKDEAGQEVHPRASFLTRAVTLVVVVSPFLGLIAALAYLWGSPFYWSYIAIFATMYTIAALGIGVGFHRLFTHKSFETSKPLRFFWAALGSVAVEGPIITWVAVHRKHHQHTDAPGDPHSPHVRDHDEVDGFRSLMRGVWHSHIGWLFEPLPADLDRYVPDLIKDKSISFISRTFGFWVLLGLVAPAIAGGLITGTWTGALLGFLWGGLVRIFFVHHVTWSINSVCHLWGTRPFHTRDESRDNPIFGVLAFGEGWHNAHHAFPASARHGLEWWKLDINYIVIRTMELCGLVTHVRVPSPERISEKRRTSQH